MAACLTVLAISACGCEATASTGARGEDAGGAAVETPASSRADAPSIEEQVAIVTGRSDVTLTPIEGAEAWLGGEGLAAFVDPQTHDEFIVDETREMLLSYDPGTRIYQDPIDLPPFPGEPSREQIRALADEWATQYLPDREISTMRCTLWRRVIGSQDQGDVLGYDAEYRRYVNGVRISEFANVSISMPTWDWTPSRSAFEHAQECEPQPSPAVSMLDALDTAVEAAGFEGWSVKKVDLNCWKDDYRWSFEIENLSAQPMVMGENAAWVDVDAMTGECDGASRDG